MEAQFDSIANGHVQSDDNDGDDDDVLGREGQCFLYASSCCNNPRQIFALCGVTKRQRKFLFDSLPTLKNVEEQSVIFNLKF